MNLLSGLSSVVNAVNDDNSFPDFTVRVENDLMSLMQHYDSRENLDVFIPICNYIIFYFLVLGH